MNAVEYVVLPGEVNKDTRRRVLEEIEKCDCPHFLILFRDSKLQFRALYAFYPDTEEVRLDPSSAPDPKLYYANSAVFPFLLVSALCCLGLSR